MSNGPPDPISELVEAARARADAAALRTPTCPAPAAMLCAWKAKTLAARFPHAITCPCCQKRIASFERVAVPPVPFAELPRFPRRLTEALLADLRRGRAPEIESYERADADAWACRVVAREQTFAAYVRRLREWLPEPDLTSELAADVLAAVVERGPGAITDLTALAALLLSPNQFTQLRGAVLAHESPFWGTVATRVTELHAQHESRKDQETAVVTNRLRRITANVTPWKPGPVTRPLDLLGDDGKALKTEILSRCYGNATDFDELDEPFGLTLHADPVPDNDQLIRLRLTVIPAPVLAPVEMAVAFPGLDGKPLVTFAVPACPERRDEATSGPSEPLPWAALAQFKIVRVS